VDLHIDSFSVVGCTVLQTFGVNYIAQKVRNIIAVIVECSAAFYFMFACGKWMLVLFYYEFIVL